MLHAGKHIMARSREELPKKPAIEYYVKIMEKIVEFGVSATWLNKGNSDIENIHKRNYEAQLSNL